jgi:hypothetical protein
MNAAKAILVAASLVAVAAPVALADVPPGPPPTQAPAPKATARAEVLVIHATKQDGGASIDERLRKLPTGKKPFSEYNTFKVLDQQTIPLEKGKPASYAIATGRTLRVTWSDMTKDGRYAIAAAIDQPGQTEYLKALEVAAAAGEPFFVGGQSYRGGTLILAITVRP